MAIVSFFYEYIINFFLGLDRVITCTAAEAAAAAARPNF